ncbi:MAG: hypothetical protein IT372_39410 [Polyangiaceae bacterium]|nr:hypothetical protein [Polyangiaceae bacterium]
MLHRFVIASLCALPIALAAAPASATAVACGSTSAGWNVPNGGVAFNRGGGPIRSVINAIGEWRTHSMLSHGPGGYVTHATMKTPDRTASWPDVCNWPLNRDQLASGYPGLEQVNQGAIYQFLYGDTDPSERTTWMAWQLGDASRVGQNGDPARAAAIANWVWFSMPYDAELRDGVPIYFPKRDGARIPYTLFQYRAVEDTNVGGGSWNNGMVCSTFLSYAHVMGGQGALPAHTYNHDQVAGAIDALHSGTYNACAASNGWLGSLLATITCPFIDVCAEAADQVTNCMATHTCNSNNQAYWQGVRNDPLAVATSVSPDQIGGWGGHPRGSAPGASTWSSDWDHGVQWNSGGNVYGCWY